MTWKIRFWNGDPNNGGQEIPGEMTRQDDGAFTFRPYLPPKGTIAEIYVTNEDGDHATMLPVDQLVKRARS